MESLELVGNRCIFSKATVLGYAAEEGGENLNQSAVLWMLSWEVERFLSLCGKTDRVRHEEVGEMGTERSMAPVTNCALVAGTSSDVGEESTLCDLKLCKENTAKRQPRSLDLGSIRASWPTNDPRNCLTSARLYPDKNNLPHTLVMKMLLFLCRQIRSF